MRAIVKMTTIALLLFAAGCSQGEPPSETTAPSPSAESTLETQPQTPDPFQQAIDSAQNAAELTQSAKSWERWQEVVTQWQQAIALLKTVSAQHPKRAIAQQKIGEYETNLTYAEQQVARFDPLNLALDKGYEAAQLTRGASGKEPWQQVAQRWESAIAQLKTVPQTHEKTALAQQKITEYESNLAIAHQKLERFEPFYQALSQGERAADLTQSATTMVQWERVAVLWKQAIATLESIPPEEEEAAIVTEKIREYESNLTYAQQQVARTDPYNQAIARAQQATEWAKSANSMAEWERVAEEWQGAIALLKKVPPTHSKGALAQKQFAEYQQNLAFAQQQIQETDPFRRAIAKAKRAIELANSAFSLYDWNAIASEWQGAIALLKTVPETHSQRAIAVQKIAEYQTYLDYSIQQAQRRLEPFATPAPPETSLALTQ